MAQLLIIDDNESMREGLELLLRKRGHRTLSARGGEEGLRLLAEEGADLIITDLKMSQIDGLTVLRRARETHPDTEVLVITGFGTVETAVEAMKLGAADFLTKPFSSEEFAIKVERLLKERETRTRLTRENIALRVENQALKEEGDPRYGEIVGDSTAMTSIFRWIERVSRSDSTVIIYGESGTGKELVARALHARSPRASGPFVRVNCGALAEGLLDSELFGHERGAFTGADRKRRGRFEMAHGGTLFLDEIATVSPATQVRLLRVLQERELERVGGEEMIEVDVRIVAATNTPPEKLRNGDGFREDLFYRLHVVPITLPPLRERTSDIPLLVRHFLEKLRARTGSRVTHVSSAAMSLLQAHDWPGNVRELENVVERALVLADGPALEVADLPALGSTSPLIVSPTEGPPVIPEGGVDLTGVVEGMEEKLIREALDRADGVKAEAARLLGLKPSALYYKMEKYGISA